MAVTKTLTNLRDDWRAATDQDGFQQVSDTQGDVWINEAVRKLWSIAARIARDEYVKLSTSFTVSAGDTVTHVMGTGGDGATDFMEIRGVDVQMTTGLWYRIKPLRFSARDRTMGIQWRAMHNTLWFFPPLLAPQFTYRAWYVPTPQVLVHGTGSTYAALLVNTDDSIDLPLGGDDYIRETVAVKVRERLEEDPSPHIAAQAAALDDMRKWLVMHNRGEPVAPGEALEDETYGLW